jgi:hypothetical protein
MQINVDVCGNRGHTVFGDLLSQVHTHDERKHGMRRCRNATWFVIQLSLVFQSVFPISKPFRGLYNGPYPEVSPKFPFHRRHSFRQNSHSLRSFEKKSRPFLVLSFFSTIICRKLFARLLVDSDTHNDRTTDSFFQHTTIYIDTRPQTKPHNPFLHFLCFSLPLSIHFSPI